MVADFVPKVKVRKINISWRDIMANGIRSITCPNCGNDRDENMSEACSVCSSREVRFLGYTYGHEAKTFFRAIYIISAVVLLALLAGAYFLFTAYRLGTFG